MADWIYEVKETGSTEWRRVPLREACQRLNLRLKISTLGRYLSIKGLLGTIRETGRPTPVPPLSGHITDPLDPGWLRARRPQPGEIKFRKSRRSRSVNKTPETLANNVPPTKKGRKSKPSPPPTPTLLARKQPAPRKARSPRPSKPALPTPPPPVRKPSPPATPQKTPLSQPSTALAKARAAKQAKAALNAKRAAALAKARAAKAARRTNA